VANENVRRTQAERQKRTDTGEGLSDLGEATPLPHWKGTRMNQRLVKLCLFPLALLLWAFWHRYESPYIGYPVRCAGGMLDVEAPRRKDNVN